MAKHTRSWFQHVFGATIGEMLSLVIGPPLAFIVLILVFITFPQIIIWLTTLNEREPSVLEQLPPNSQTVVKELADAQLKTQELISNLESNVQSTERLIQEKQKALEELQRSTTLLQLTPEQLIAVRDYNSSMSSDFNFGVWIRRRTTWFDLLSAFIISFFFYVLGVLRGRNYSRRNRQN